MDFTLTRKEFIEDGIFSELEGSGGVFFICLEHAYKNGSGGYSPKLPDGKYTCVRGEHKLGENPQPFETFEITNVPGHFGVLFHVGNYNNDSEGCVLVGSQIGRKLGGGKMIMGSRDAFKKFMESQKEIDTFTLSVETVS